MENFLNTLVSWATTTGIKIIVALILLFISFKLINFFAKKIGKACEKKNLDKTITKALLYLSKLLLKCIVVVALIGYLGIDTSAITALIASFGVCIGLAVNGTVSNLAGGVLILITSPFRVDDFMEAQGVSGTVVDIRITHTKLNTPDNKVITIPNGTVMSESITNYSANNTRRVELVFGVAYGTDVERVKKILLEEADRHEMVLKDPAPFARLTKQNDSSLDFTLRVWAENANYWQVNFDLLEAINNRLEAEGIEIPFNQLDVHITK